MKTVLLIFLTIFSLNSIACKGKNGQTIHEIKEQLEQGGLSCKIHNGVDLIFCNVIKEGKGNKLTFQFEIRDVLDDETANKFCKYDVPSMYIHKTISIIRNEDGTFN